MRFWALVPARGGSKSVPLKNLHALDGRPLLDYGVLAARAWGGFERIVCSTDHAAIATRSRELGIEVDARPPSLAGDAVAVAAVARDFLVRAGASAPDWLFLIQPTSPFLLPAHLELLAARIRGDADARSAQTIAPVPHNHHAWNQRLLENGHARFANEAERRQGYNKQSKPERFVFGNLVAAQARALIAGGDFFSPPSLAVLIERPYDMDVDSAEDFRLADALLAQRCVALAHLSE